MNDELKQQIEDVIRRILFPTPMMKWMDGLQQAERVGRIKRAKMSVLRYGIQRYVQSQLPEIDPVFRLDISPMDDEITIGGRNPLTPENNWLLTFAYPIWLQDFFAEDENFDLLLREDETKLQEVLQRIFEWCYEHKQYRCLVEPA